MTLKKSITKNSSVDGGDRRPANYIWLYTPTQAKIDSYVLFLKNNLSIFFLKVSSENLLRKTKPLCKNCFLHFFFIFAEYLITVCNVFD